MCAGKPEGNASNADAIDAEHLERGRDRRQTTHGQQRPRRQLRPSPLALCERERDTV